MSSLAIMNATTVVCLTLWRLIQLKREAMARFIVQNRLKDRSELQDFNAGGYLYQPERSEADNLVFMRDAGV